MVAREYLIKQAEALLRLPRTVKDPTLSAGLLGKAVALEEKASRSTPEPLQ